MAISVIDLCSAVTLSIQGFKMSPLIFFLIGMLSSGGLFLAIRFIRRRKYLSLSSIGHSILDERDQLHTLINNLPDAVYIKDNAGKYILANNQFVRLLKTESPESILGKTDAEIYKSGVADKYTLEDRKILQGEIPVLRRKQESTREENPKITTTTKLPIRNRKNTIIGILGIYSDITESELASRQLQEKNEMLEKERSLLRAVMDNIPDAIYIKDLECKFLHGNPNQVQITKAGTPENLIGKTDFDFYPQDIAKIFYRDDKKVITTGKPVISKEEIGFDPEGNIRMKSTTKVPFRDAEGKIIGLVGIGRDITKLKENEEKLKEQASHLQEVNVLLEERQERIQLQSEELNRQTQNLKKANTQLELLNSTKNKFFSIIAHDLKNPFQAIFGFSELLMRNFDDFDDHQKVELLGMIKTSSESAYNLLENLLQWARTQTDRIKYNPDYIMLAEIIDQNIELISASAENKQITLISQIDCESTVFADRNMINLVVRNLLSNAVKFTEEKGIVTVGCEIFRNNQMRVYISDTGIGISEQNIRKLFRIDEYFSTAGTAGEGGTGLGLIICKEFIKKNKGKLHIESKLGEGTTFTFMLPVKRKA